MHIKAVAGGSSASQTTTEFAGMLLQQEGGLEWSENVFKASWAFIVHILTIVWTWFTRLGPSLSLSIFAIPPAWTFQSLFDACSFVAKHPHPFHIIGWSIFFGPIIILIPCLLLLEILILVLFNLSFVFHGMIPGSMEDRFGALKEYFAESRETIFASIEHWTAVFNKWTTDCPPLLVLRLLAGAMSIFILFGLWSGW
ncbi:hypothetical protein BDZ97DRAFT_1066886 [Flammula alnicola]|nr:hypothetical protein BDZ97DRAFT_1066886 [Flammula alnicola]